MGVTPSGTGTGWDESSPDVDQPHGLAYRANQDLRIGVRIRLEKEHVCPSTSSVGGDHLPGGCNILHRQDASGAAADLDSKAGDATGYHTGGLACLTGFDATSCTFWFYDDNTAATPIYMTPGSLCLGADYTWSGAHAYEGTVDITGNTAFGADVSVDATLVVGGNLVANADFCVDSTADFAGDVAFAADISVDATVVCGAGFIAEGTGIFTSNLDISGNLDVSGTLAVSDISGNVQVPDTYVCFSGSADGGAAGTDNVWASANISDVSQTATGKFTVYFTNNFSDTNYIPFVSARHSAIAEHRGVIRCCSKAVGSVGVFAADAGGTFKDVDEIDLVVFGT